MAAFCDMTDSCYRNKICTKPAYDIGFQPIDAGIANETKTSSQPQYNAVFDGGHGRASSNDLSVEQG